MTSDWLGWVGAAVLLATITRQVWTQWRTRSVAGVSHWLFIGQLTASGLFLAYSLAQGDVVFTVTNALMLAAGVTGQLIFMRNRRVSADAAHAPRVRQPAGS